MSSLLLNLRFIIAYDGTSFLGWQKTKMGPSVEETLERALSQILQQPVSLQAASRTDAGVHAKGQVVNALIDHPSLSLPLLLRALNGVLPKTIRILSVDQMHQNFHPTLDATGKCYLYQICNGPLQLPFYRHLSWHFPSPLDVNRIQEAIPFFLGTHDFSSFCNERKQWTRSPLCTLRAISLSLQSFSRLFISITGDHFLYKMARNIAGTLSFIGCGKLLVKDVPEILKGANRARAGITAPAHGLTLHHVLYEGIP